MSTSSSQLMHTYMMSHIVGVSNGGQWEDKSTGFTTKVSFSTIIASVHDSVRIFMNCCKVGLDYLPDNFSPTRLDINM